MIGNEQKFKLQIKQSDIDEYDSYAKNNPNIQIFDIGSDKFVFETKIDGGTISVYLYPRKYATKNTKRDFYFITSTIVSDVNKLKLGLLIYALKDVPGITFSMWDENTEIEIVNNV